MQAAPVFAGSGRNQPVADGRGFFGVFWRRHFGFGWSGHFAVRNNDKTAGDYFPLINYIVESHYFFCLALIFFRQRRDGILSADFDADAVNR
ncbi:MAG: hypothetical protein LiPW39_29 [Parcubacteria group bacterium LiPW_39]|nr:MAG: hypothetical protein LiPW39_29 [Parcubacteria group bacterium LiPW_39]